MKRKVLAGLLTVVMAAGFVAVPGMQTEVKADDKKLVGVAMPTKDLQRWNQDGENKTYQKNTLRISVYCDCRFSRSFRFRSRI